MSDLNQMIVGKIEAGNLLEDQGKPKDALSVYLSIWKDLDSLEIEKYEAEETRWLINCIYETYISLDDYHTARKWAEDIFNCKIPEPATSELIDLGRIYYELGKKNESFELFLKAYKKGKDRAFKEYDKKYLEFFKSHKKQHQTGENADE